jgi:phosphonate transport system permease protein
MDTTMKKLPPKPIDTKKKIKHWVIAIVTVALIIWSFVGMNFGGIKATAGQIAGAILAGIFHPDWSYVYNGSGEDLISQLWETICIAFLGYFYFCSYLITFCFLGS